MANVRCVSSVERLQGKGCGSGTADLLADHSDRNVERLLRRTRYVHADVRVLELRLEARRLHKTKSINIEATVHSSCAPKT